MNEDIAECYISVKGWNLYIKLSKNAADLTNPGMILIHGLASTHQSFDEVSFILQRNGCITASIDLKGHGNSIKDNKMDNTDIDNENEFTISALADDIADIISILRCHPLYEHLDSNPWSKPVLLCGHSYGGTIALEVATNYPSLVQGIICIDGGHINLKKSFPQYEDCERELHPPDFKELRWNTLEKAVREQWCYDWPESGKIAMLNNFKKVEVQLDLDDYTTKFPKPNPDSPSQKSLELQLDIERNKTVSTSPKLKVEHVMPKLLKSRHLLLLKNLWEFNPMERYPLCQCPVLLLPTGDGQSAPFTNNKKNDVKDATDLLKISNVIWFETASHDLPSQFPMETANTILNAMKKKYFT